MAASLHLSLPEPLRTYVEAQVAAGDYGTPGEYVIDLIRTDRDRRAARIEEHLLGNLKSKPISFSDEELARGNFVSLCRSKLSEAL